jgi:hypothetical protein
VSVGPKAFLCTVSNFKFCVSSCWLSQWAFWYTKPLEGGFKNEMYFQICYIRAIFSRTYDVLCNIMDLPLRDIDTVWKSLRYFCFVFSKWIQNICALIFKLLVVKTLLSPKKQIFHFGFSNTFSFYSVRVGKKLARECFSAWALSSEKKIW